MGHKFNNYNDYNKRKSFFNLSTEHKVYIGGAIATVIILAGGIFLISNTGSSTSALAGKNVPISGRQHFPDGTKITYDTNPPAEGNHYPEPQPAGVYTTPPPDGNLVHSLEHGAVILWYNPKMLSKDQVKQLTALFNSISLPKTIMTPRDSMDVPVAITSWGQILKLKTIDEKQIRNFFETNYDRGPEHAPI